MTATPATPYASWFTECVEMIDKPLGEPLVFGQKEAEFIKHAITNGQRFFLPKEVSLIEGKSYTDIRPLLNLPFDLIAIATEDKAIDQDAENGQPWMRSIVCAHKLQEGDGFAFISANRGFVEGRNTWSFSLLHSARWVDSAQLKLGKLETPYARQLSRHPSSNLLEEFATADLSTIQNLCLILGLANTQTRTIEPPQKVNAKRERNGKLPLYSYHVLEVGGEVWDSYGRDDGDGNGYRSHLRRGHIRRLADDRCVWVRAAYVHGRQPGFVDKDYDVKAPTP